LECVSFRSLEYCSYNFSMMLLFIQRYKMHRNSAIFMKICTALVQKGAETSLLKHGIWNTVQRAENLFSVLHSEFSV
jgi:hypothetical protein